MTETLFKGAPLRGSWGLNFLFSEETRIINAHAKAGSNHIGTGSCGQRCCRTWVICSE